MCVRARISRAASLSASREEETGRSSFRSSDNFLHSLSSFPRQALAIASRASSIAHRRPGFGSCVSFSSVGRRSIGSSSRIRFRERNPKSDIYITVTGRRPAARGAIDSGGKYRTVSRTFTDKVPLVARARSRTQTRARVIYSRTHVRDTREWHERRRERGRKKGARKENGTGRGREEEERKSGGK